MLHAVACILEDELDAAGTLSHTELLSTALSMLPLALLRCKLDAVPSKQAYGSLLHCMLHLSLEEKGRTTVPGRQVMVLFSRPEC